MGICRGQGPPQSQPCSAQPASSSSREMAALQDPVLPRNPNLGPSLGRCVCGPPSCPTVLLVVEGMCPLLQPRGCSAQSPPAAHGPWRGRAVLLDHARVKAGAATEPSSRLRRKVVRQVPGSQAAVLPHSPRVRAWDKTCVWSRKHHLAFGF